MNLEFLSGNELRKFPFTDDSFLESDSGFVLGNDFFLDLLFHHKTVTAPFYLKLTRLVVVANTSVQIYLSMYDSSDTIIGSAFSFVVPFADVVNMQTIVSDHTAYWVKLVFGRGMVNTLTQNIDESFDLLTFTDVAVVPALPKVEQIRLYNQETLFKTVTTDQVSDIELVLEEGTNLAIADDGVNTTFDVFPGYGAGLYDACSDALFISTINFIPPSRDNNFLFLADSCYTTTPLTHGLLLENHCKPKCTIEHFENFVHYINRIKDGISTVGALAASTGTDLTTQIDDYNSTYVPVKNKPYIKHAYAKFPGSGGTYFYSVVAGIFNTRNTDIAFDIMVSHGGAFVPDTGRWRVKDTAILLGSSAYAGILPCLSVGKLEFVFSATAGSTFTISGSLEGVAITPIVVTVT